MFRMFIFACFVAHAQTGSVDRLYPIDETARDSSFRSYVKKLRSAVEARDPGALRKLVDDEVFVGPDDAGKGWDRFAAKWRPDDPDSAVWSALTDLLSLGFIREHPTLFVSPYLVWRFPRELNPAMHLVVIRDKIPLRQSAAVDAPVVAVLSFDIVRQLGPPASGDGLQRWIFVRTLDGKEGYLNARDVMSPLMPRAQFATRRGKWMLVALE